MMESLNRANSLFVQDQFSSAIPLYQEALADASCSLEAQIGLSSSYLKLGELHNAEISATRAIEIDPSSSLAHFRKGQALFYQMKFQESLIEFESSGNLGNNWVEKCKTELHRNA
ncbi:unnamed protein product [Blepharisma stoltei]|uniref:Tetratricopeptide repeat protein n=1 Tax=Blepharisma stoltei TaxID=1481888 RepID=A0AAU9IP87_9CILI|nr:unnamed protein product [Blepharisma stoltei]